MRATVSSAAPAGTATAPASSVDDQIRDIAATFVASDAVPRHPTDPSLTVVDALPVYPYFEMWATTYAPTTPGPTPRTPRTRAQPDGG
jgi:hypothetical protein